MDILSSVGNKNFALLSKMLDLSQAKQKVISQNIANVNTPNYRRRELKFDQALRNAMEEGTPEAYQAVQGWVDRPNTTPVRNNGNNVDIDMEMIDMKENALLYQTYTEIYNRKSMLVRKAIKGV